MPYGSNKKGSLADKIGFGGKKSGKKKKKVVKKVSKKRASKRASNRKKGRSPSIAEQINFGGKYR